MLSLNLSGTVTGGSTPPAYSTSFLTGASATSFTRAYTSSSGTDRLLVVFVFYWNDTRTISGITYNGVALTKIATQATGGAGTRTMEVWYLFNPATGTNNLAITATGGGADKQFAAITFTGASQSIAPTAFTASGSSTTPSVAVTGSTTDLFADCIGQNGTSVTITEGAGQTDLGGHSEGGNQNIDASYKAGATSTTMSWTTSSNNNWAHCAVRVPPA